MADQDRSPGNQPTADRPTEEEHRQARNEHRLTADDRRSSANDHVVTPDDRRPTANEQRMVAGGDAADLVARRFASRSLGQDDPTGWFEELYASAEAGQAVVPWDRGAAHPLLTEWVEASQPDGIGRSAVVIGAGTGWDAELVADRGFRTTAFDISPTAIATARRTHPDTKVDYLTADLLDPPGDWHRAFDLVVEIFTVQALPISLQPAAVKQVGELVRAGGTLVVIAAARPDDQPDESVEGPPWPLTRSTIESFATDDLRLIQLTTSPGPSSLRWVAEFLRD